MPLTHSHFCKHCDKTWSCIDDPCLLEFVDGKGYEVRYHGCAEQLEYKKKMGRMLRGAGKRCIYNCTGPCHHPKFREKVAQGAVKALLLKL